MKKQIIFDMDGVLFDTENLVFSCWKFAAGKFMLTVFGAVAELEREYLLQRQREGIAIAKSKGVYKGRRPVERPELELLLHQWKQGKLKAVEVMARLHISKTTFYRKVKEANLEKEDV